MLAHRPTRHFVACMVTVAFLSGCNEPSVPGKLTPGQEVTLKGRLVAGAECPMIEVEGGHRYAVAGELGAFKVGDWVCLRGVVAAMSICMAGEATITVRSIDTENACP